MATGEMHTVREFVEKAFAVVGISVAWRGAGVDEVGVDVADETKVLVAVDAAYFRPTEVDLLVGDPSKAARKLNWVCRVHFNELVREMVEGDLALVDSGNLVD